MRLAHLRHQMLLAMGLPACWIQQGPDPRVPPPPDRGPPSVTARPVDPPTVDSAPADPAPVGPPPVGPPPVDPPPVGPGRGQALAVDDPRAHPSSRTVAVAAASCTREQVCGRSDTRHGRDDCGPNGRSLESFGGDIHLPITQIDFTANQPMLATFTLDPSATAAFQRRVSSVGPTLPRYCCYAQCTLDHQASPPPLQAPAGQHVATTCVPAASIVPSPRFRGGAVTGNPECAESLEGMPYVRGTNSQCCYGRLEVLEVPDDEPRERRHYRGRVARVEGEARVAPVRASPGWDVLADRVEVTTLTPAERAQLAAAWTQTAQMEHASIAAFSALSLRLLALGAPAELVARTHEAALDELRHAQVAFALASAYADAALAPAPFAEAGELATGGALVDLAVETLVDGCLDEGTAAVEASVAAGLARDAAVARVLRTIALEEARHAELAWAIVAWCVRREPAIAPALRAALARVGDRVRPWGGDAPVDDASPLARHGVLSDAALRGLRADTLREVVEPCLAALLASVPQA